MTALDLTAGKRGDWLNLVSFAQLENADTGELYSRLLFGTEIGNTANHLRNHGFLRRAHGWQLAPLFDVNPTPLTKTEHFELSRLGQSSISISDVLTGEV